MSERTKLFELLEMCFYGHINEVKRLVDKGVNVNKFHANGSSPLLAALNGENYDIVKYLIKRGANINNGDWTILHEAIDLVIDDMIQNELQEPNKELMNIIKYLIENGADIDKKDERGVKPLELIKIYSGSYKNFEKLKGFFVRIIPNLNEKIIY